jgi:predicted unusual protein kinase regulating ubiquinone biosynthesis (AarF/ABC1/UbiB family)
MGAVHKSCGSASQEAAFGVCGCRGHPALTFIDAGITTELSSADRENFTSLFYAIATGR